jgi:hypothetical protein
VLDLSPAKIDTQKVDNGAWWVIRMEGGVIYGRQVEKPASDEPALLIVPAGYAYDRQLERETDPYLKKLRREDISDRERDELMTEATGRAVAKKILRGWQNIAFGGEQHSWSEERAAEILAMREWRNLLEFCVMAASDKHASLAAQEADSKGN